MCEARVQDGAAMEEDGAEVGGRGSREARGGVVTMVTIDPKEFPLLLSRQVHAAVVDGLAANLLHVEVGEERQGRGGGSEGFVFCSNRCQRSTSYIVSKHTAQTLHSLNTM